eukprot:scaffold4844_cov165-Pinguiococcus_pyrenoidosus.AAC.1
MLETKQVRVLLSVQRILVFILVLHGFTVHRMHHSEAGDGRTLPLIPVLLGAIVRLEAGFGAGFALVIDAPCAPHGLVAPLVG